MTLCRRFDDCPFLKNFHEISDVIQGSEKINPTDNGRFLKYSDTVLNLTMTYVCNEQPEKCLFYGKK